jgi:hypothetical protein
MTMQANQPMKIPIVRGLIDRRMLINFRVDPDAIRPLLPSPFIPKLVGGFAMAGICLIRLRGIRPRFLPAIAGIRSENAAHRIAVEWDDDRGRQEGVFVVRRDSSSRLNSWLGGRLFPGVHHHATFRVQEGEGRYSLAMDSDDGSARIRVEARETAQWPTGSIFPSLGAASVFFEGGSLGYSPGAAPSTYEGLQLKTDRWAVEPLEIRTVESSFFEDARRFAPGSALFDCALLMRGVPHEWHGRPPIMGRDQTAQPPVSAAAIS